MDFAGPSNSIGAVLSFDETIRQHRNELVNAANEDEKLKIVKQAIRGVGKFSSIGHDKIISFHELVISPLASLCQLNIVLDKFMKKI